MRTALIFFEMNDSSEIPPAAEPFFMGLGANITLSPVMNAQEMQSGVDQGEGSDVVLSRAPLLTRAARDAAPAVLARGRPDRGGRECRIEACSSAGGVSITPLCDTWSSASAWDLGSTRQTTGLTG